MRARCPDDFFTIDLTIEIYHEHGEYILSKFDQLIWSSCYVQPQLEPNSFVYGVDAVGNTMKVRRAKLRKVRLVFQ